MAEREIPDLALQSALEFAVLIAAAGQKVRPPLPIPAGLKPFLRFHKLPPKALATVREVVEGDEAFLSRLGTGAQAELVDPVGMLWLQRPEGWFEQALALLPAVPEADEHHDARAERRRREAAESAATRTRLEVIELREALARERVAAADDAALRERLGKELRAATARIAELESTLRRRGAGADEAAARADAASDEVASLRERLAAAERARDEALASRAVAAGPTHDERLRSLLLEALSVAGGAPAERRGRRPAARTPLPIPGGLYGDSEAAAEHLLRSPGVLVLVDGYNVAKLGWPDLVLRHQRERCVEAAETVARRWGTDIHVVFDGAEVVGAHSKDRRLVRVSWSPEGVTADDVLRAETAATEVSRPVVVVTNDQAVVTDVRALGANTLTSDSFLAVARR